MDYQVIIIGGGPAGLLLAAKLAADDTSVVVLEQRSRKYVLSRIRAGVLETGTVKQLVDIGAGASLLQKGLLHTGTYIATHEDLFHVDFGKLINKKVTVYGQTEVTKDLYALLDRKQIPVIHGAKVQEITDYQSSKPKVSFESNGTSHTIQSEFVIGCDGYHGVSNNIIQKNHGDPYLMELPYGWLGVLSETPPVCDELIYSRSNRGFALASMRSKKLSRYYIQVPNDEKVINWTDQQFWEELKLRLPSKISENLISGPSVEKSIALLRSYVAKTMQDGRLLLCGDSAHIVPPTGAKGLNLAASDVFYAHEALVQYFKHRSMDGVNNYSKNALSRIWKSMRFSWWMTQMFHSDPGKDEFEARIKDSELKYLRDSQLMQSVFAENYTGLPY